MLVLCNASRNQTCIAFKDISLYTSLMKFTHSWLTEFLKTDARIDQLSDTMTAIGLEVESVESLGASLGPFTVAHILSAEKHPDADKLQVCCVHTHTGERQIVCGAPNARAGIKVILADIGDIIPTNNMKIKPAKIRGVESSGMLCSAQELGLGEDHDGIMELPEDAIIGDKIIDVLGLNDTLFDIAITPNRGDCLGVYGIARDLAAAGIGTLVTPPTKDLTHINNDAIPLALNTTDCQHFVAYRIEGATNTNSPEWLQRRLTSVGLRPISALVDITNYFTICYGRPLHAYDADTLKGGLTIRTSRKEETLSALNDKTYTLPEGLCVIADNAQALGLGGIIGGVPSGCTEFTKNVILEAAWFDPIAIANTGRTLQIDSDARYRFERGVDPATTAPLAAQAAQMIVELCGGTITGHSEAGNAPTISHTIDYSPDYAEQRSGLAVDADTQRTILATLGCNVSDSWKITTPSWRSDIEGKADIVEEIIRIVGYDTIPDAPLPYAPPALVSVSREDKIRTQCLARGLDEVTHFAFTSTAHAQQFKTDANLVTVANPISVELNTMRPHLYADMLPAAKRNHDRGHKDLALFEIGSVFFGLTPEQQPLRACSLRSGTTPLHWQHKPRDYDIFDAKADLLAMLESLNVPTGSLMVTRDVPAYYHPGKSARLSLGPKNTLGYFGEIHPAILRHFDIEMPIMASECWINSAPNKQKQSQKQALKSVEFQSSRRDFAFIVDESISAGDVQQAINKSNKTLIKEVALFDVYQGKNMEAGKKSLAFAVTLQANDRTLSEEDISKTSDAIIAAAAKKGAALR